MGEIGAIGQIESDPQASGSLYPSHQPSLKPSSKFVTSDILVKELTGSVLVVEEFNKNPKEIINVSKEIFFILFILYIYY